MQNHQRTGETAPGDPLGIFPHERALRLISAVLAEIHEEWLTGRQYLNLAGWKKQVEQWP